MRHTPHLEERRFPEGTALISAIEEITGGERGIALDPVPASLVYYLSLYAYSADTFTPEDRDSPGPARTQIRSLLQQFMKTVAAAIQEGTFVRHLDDGIYIDCFLIPQWFYDEITRRDHVPPHREFVPSL